MGNNQPTHRDSNKNVVLAASDEEARRLLRMRRARQEMKSYYDHFIEKAKASHCRGSCMKKQMDARIFNITNKISEIPYTYMDEELSATEAFLVTSGFWSKIEEIDLVQIDKRKRGT